MNQPMFGKRAVSLISVGNHNFWRGKNAPVRPNLRPRPCAPLRAPRASAPRCGPRRSGPRRSSCARRWPGAGEAIRESGRVALGRSCGSLCAGRILFLRVPVYPFWGWLFREPTGKQSFWGVPLQEAYGILQNTTESNLTCIFVT